MTLPRFFNALPALDLPFPEAVATSRAVRPNAGMALLLHFRKQSGLPPQAQGPQVGTVVAGEVTPAVDGWTRGQGPGMSCYGPAGVEHGVAAKADTFAEPDRHPLEARRDAG